jgi:hypothetical protein
LLAVVEQEQLKPVISVIVSFVRHMTVVLGVVAKAAVGVVLDESSDLRAPAWRAGGV